MDPQLLSYYEAIERASADMLAAARSGNWDEVVKLEGACVLLISRLKHAAQEQDPSLQGARRAADAHALEAAKAKSRIMQRILVNDAEIRHLAEPWLQDLDDTLAGRGPGTGAGDADGCDHGDAACQAHGDAGCQAHGAQASAAAGNSGSNGHSTSTSTSTSTGSTIGNRISRTLH